MEKCAQDNPTISVVIPCYNCMRYIDQTLLSLEQQTQKDFEVICINDGSTDGTLQRLEQWQQKGSLRLRIIDQPNGGVSRARNRGIEETTGEYLLFLDSDDIIHPEFVSVMLNAIIQSEADTAYCRLTRDLDKLQKVDAHCAYVQHTQEQAMHDLLFCMGSYSFCCYVYRMQILRQNRIFFTEGLTHFEDREFNWKYLAHCKNAAWLDIPLYGYRESDTSVVRAPITWERIQSGADAVARVETYLRVQECPYTPIVEDYLCARVLWGRAKSCAICRNKALFLELCQTFDMKRYMRRTARDKNKLVALASRLYLIHPMLFYNIVKLKK